MKFENNLKFDEIILRYAIMLILGIIAGATSQFWILLLAMYLFLEAILGWSPIKQKLAKKHT